MLELAVGVREELDGVIAVARSTGGAACDMGLVLGRHLRACKHCYSRGEVCAPRSSRLLGHILVPMRAEVLVGVTVVGEMDGLACVEPDPIPLRVEEPRPNVLVPNKLHVDHLDPRVVREGREGPWVPDPFDVVPGSLLPVLGWRCWDGCWR